MDDSTWLRLRLWLSVFGIAIALAAGEAVVYAFYPIVVVLGVLIANMPIETMEIVLRSMGMLTLACSILALPIFIQFLRSKELP